MATAQELIDKIRFNYLSDGFDGYATATQEERDENVLWTDAQLLELLNDSYQEACIRGEILTEDTPFSLKIKALKNGYSISQQITQLRYVSISTQDQPAIEHVSRVDMEDNGKFPDWRIATGEPTHYWMHGYKMFLYPTPIIDAVVTLEGYAYPDEMGLSDEPAIPLNQHKDLIWGVLSKAYLRNDADGYDSSRADYYDTKFIRAFGPPIDNRVIVHQLENLQTDNYIGGINYLGTSCADSDGNTYNKECW